MAGPGDEDTSPATTPDRDSGPPAPRVVPSMSDDQIRTALRDAYFRIADDAATEFALNDAYPTKDLASFKALLKDVWSTDDEAFRPRFEQLQQQVIDDIGSQLFAHVTADPRHTIALSSGAPAPTAANVAEAADPVHLFDGDFRHSTVDFQLNGAGIDLVFARTYSQLASYAGPLGQKWDHSLNLWIRLDEGGTSLHRSTGALAEETFTRHETLSYWVPPPGVHGTVVETGQGLDFVRSDGNRITYEQQPGVADAVFLATRIADRFGNALTIDYADGLLAQIHVNHPDRRVELLYDDQQRIVAVRDFTGRTWQYHYDTETDLVAATMPATAANPRGTTTFYEYLSPALAPPDLAHHLTSITDANGRIWLENEYGADAGLLGYRRVVRQRQGGGEVHFEYADVVEEFDLPYDEHERPRFQTVVTERDGQQGRHLFNAQGNLIMQEEVGRIDGLPALLTRHFRYNRDGNLVGVMSPLGALTQALWGRDLYERQFPAPQGARPDQDPNLTPQARLTFGNLLTVVKRAETHDIGQLSSTAGLWSQDVFPDILGTDDTDVIQKFTYESETGQVLSTSDPRVTGSASPDATEGAEYERRLTRYTYDTGPPVGRLTRIDLPTPTLPDGQQGEAVATLFSAYDDHGRVMETVAPNGLRTVNDYEPDTAGVRAGFLTGRTIDPTGADLRHGVEPDDLGRTVRVSRPAAQDTGDDRFVSTVVYDELSRIVESVSTAPLRIRTVNSFDRAGELVRSETEIVAADGTRTGSLVTTNRYDEEGRLVRQQIGDPAGSTVKTQRIGFDAAGRPTIQLSPTGRIRKVRYNERSLVSTVIEDLGGAHMVTRRLYDGDGRLSRLVDPRRGTTRYIYDALGHNIATEDPLGNRLVRHFDKLGNPLVECLFERRDDAFVLVHRRELGYDELGRLITAATNRFDEPSAVTPAATATAFRDSGPGGLLALQFFRNALDDIVKEIDQDGREFPVEFDILGRVVARTDPAGNEVHLGYDQEGNVVRVDRREVTLDGSAVPDEQWFAEAFSFDELNRMASHSTPAGTSLFVHDSRGLPTVVTDPAGDRTEHDYDVFGRRVATRRLLREPGPTDVVTPVRSSFGYNRDDQLTEHTDPLGRVTGFEYDSAGRLHSAVLPDSSSDEYGYDAAGNVVSYRDRNGTTRHLTWDPLGRNTDIVVDAAPAPAGPSPPAATTTGYEYDALGRIRRATNDFATIEVEHDSLAVTAETVSFSAASGMPEAGPHRLTRETSDTGAVTALTYPSGRRLRYDRDTLDRVVAVTQTSRGQGYPGDPSTPDQLTVSTLEYQGLRPRRVTRGNGLVTTYGYDFCGRTVDLLQRAAGGLVLHQQQLYDAASRVAQREEAAASGSLVQRLERDSLSRLTAVRAGPGVLPDLSVLGPPASRLPDPLPDRQGEVDALLTSPGDIVAEYQLDAAGNRTTALTSSGAHTYEPNDLDQYARVDGDAATFDPNGNRTDDPQFGYSYDYRNLLVELRDKAGGATTGLLRDAFGRVCAERSGTDTRVWLHDGRRVIEEHAGGGLRRSVVSAGSDDQYLLESVSSFDGYLLNDLTRSVRAVHDGATTRARYSYDEFGRLLGPPVAGDENAFFFGGMRQVGGSGTYDFDYRTYDPSDGRFLQRDPRGFVDGSNLYPFAGNDPTTLTDPRGTESRKEHPPIAAKLGAELAYRHPEGFTLAVPENFEKSKIKAYRERINDPLDRGVGIRSRPPGMRTSTTDIRRRTQNLRDAYESSLPGGRRPLGTDIDHTVELQHTIRQRPGQFAPGADQVRPQDHRVQDSSLNNSQGSRAQKVKARQVRNGAPLDTSAGGVAYERDVNKLWNREGYRTGVRAFGYYNLVGGTFDSLTSVGESIREGDYASAAVGTSAYLGGAFEIGGIAARSSTLLSAGRWLGAPAAVVSSGVLGVRIGTNLYENYVDKEMCLDAGSWVEEKTGSRVLGATAAAATAVGDAIVHAPEAAYDYVKDNMTLDPDEIDWDRTLKPWKWF